MDKNINKTGYILLQLGYHLPYSVFGVVLALLVVGFLSFIAIAANAEGFIPAAADELFHLLHGAHILLSAVATTAMFWKHDRHLLKAVIIGLIGSLAICGLSDIFFPFLGGILFGSEMHLHICLIEEPGIVYPFAVVGVLAGLTAPATFERATEYSHSMHVFVSSAASIMYLLAFGLQDWLHAVGAVFIITIFAVMIPCCLSDIVLPLACSHKHCHHPDILDKHVH